MDSGSACSRYNIYGQMVYWVVTSWTISLEYSRVIIWTIFSYMEYGRLLFYGDEAIYYKWIISPDVITTMLISINGTFTCCIQVILPRQFLHPMSPSPMFVYTKDNASLQSTYLILLVLLVKLFSSYDTHVPCHVMFYIITYHCII